MKGGLLLIFLKPMFILKVICFPPKLQIPNFQNYLFVYYQGPEDQYHRNKSFDYYQYHKMMVYSHKLLSHEPLFVVLVQSFPTHL